MIPIIRCPKTEKKLIGGVEVRIMAITGQGLLIREGGEGIIWV